MLGAEKIVFEYTTGPGQFFQRCFVIDGAVDMAHDRAREVGFRLA